MPVTQIAVERYSLISDRPFELVLSTLKSVIGHPDMTKLWEEIGRADTFRQVESIVKSSLGPSRLMQLGEFDDGGFIRKDRGEGTPQSMRLLIGNPLTMKEMTELVPDAAAYAPVTLLIDERNGKVHVSYDRMASHLASYGNPEAMKIAEGLDATIETLICVALFVQE